MIVCPDYDKFQFTEADLEVIEPYATQISSVDVEFCSILEHLESMTNTVVHSMPDTKLQHEYRKAISEVANACYKLDKVLMNEEVPSWYVKEKHADGHAFTNRLAYTEMIEDLITDDLCIYDSDILDEIEENRITREVKNKIKS